MKRKLWSNEEKVAIILEIVRGNESAAEICTRHGGKRNAGLPVA